MHAKNNFIYLFTINKIPLIDLRKDFLDIYILRWQERGGEEAIEFCINFFKERNAVVKLIPTGTEKSGS